MDMNYGNMEQKCHLWAETGRDRVLWKRSSGALFTAQTWNMASPSRCKIWELYHSRGTRISKAWDRERLGWGFRTHLAGPEPGVWLYSHEGLHNMEHPEQLRESSSVKDNWPRFYSEEQKMHKVQSQIPHIQNKTYIFQWCHDASIITKWLKEQDFTSCLFLVISYCIQ